MKEDIEIIYALKGGITYKDIQEMTDYEVMLISEAYKDIKETEKIAYENAKNNQNNNSESVVNRIVLPNSRFNLPKEDNPDYDNTNEN